jgi:hypothetical protein
VEAKDVSNYQRLGDLLRLAWDEQRAIHPAVATGAGGSTPQDNSH